MKKVFWISFILVLLFLSAGTVFYFYEYIFAKQVLGEIVKVERVTQTNTLIAANGGSQALAPEQLFSFAVAIRDSQGEIHTASTEDRQWAVAQAGQCVEAKFLAYPPWRLEKAGTYFGARLIRLFDCKKEK
jgi:hypothetical protein